MTQGQYNQYMNETYLPQQAFNASASMPIPGVTGSYGGYGGIPLPGQPTDYMPQMQSLPGGTPMNLSGGPPNGGWGDTAATRERTRALIGGLLAQQQSPVIPQPAPQPGQQQQTAFMPAGMYGRQAMQLAGTYSPNTPPGDTYPNGLLGGKGGGFRPGGK